MNRTDRLYAIVEELRAIAPRRRSAKELAARLEVSARTIERDLSALQQAGVPIYASAGRLGGYALDKDWSLPPLNFTPAEAVALSVALVRAGSTPFGTAGQSAMRKIIAAMSDRDASAARELATRVRLLSKVAKPPADTAVAATVERAVTVRRVLRIGYLDRFGAASERVVEPIVLMGGEHSWYLVAWCRLRSEARSFRVDRICSAELTGEAAPERRYEEHSPEFMDLVANTPVL